MPKAHVQKQKQRKSIKLKTSDRTKLQSALTTAQATYAPLAEVWPDLTIDQRQSVLLSSPILAGWLAFARQFPEV